jgi:predicted TIM-barrel fold metal-dependent hydrolase
MADRYTIISADCHAGGNHAQYREYLPSELHEQFDAWRGKYKNPFRDLQEDGRTRNWDDERRISEQAADGIVAEVVFPNTVPPFFPTGVVVAPAPKPEEYRLRLEGLRAHNRWLADFVAAHPTRRAGLGQILLNDVDDAVADVRWAKEHGLSGILLPGVSPDTPWIEPLFSSVYDPLWRECEALGLPITHHSGGSGIPDFGDRPSSTSMFVMEMPFFSQRALWHLVLSGVFERFPGLVFVMTEQGNDWVPQVLARMDHLFHRMRKGRHGELPAGEGAALQTLPSEVFARNCYLGASFATPRDARIFTKFRLVDNVMWGSDYPHHEASYPFSREALRNAFHDWSEADLRKVLAGNAARVYGFDLDALAPLAAEVGPGVDELQVPLEAIPAGATSPAFW